MCSDLVLDADRLVTQGGRHEMVYDGSRPHRPIPACSEKFFDRLTALYAVGEAKNFRLLFPRAWTATQRGGCAAN
jgi:hypothetical protein